MRSFRAKIPKAEFDVEMDVERDAFIKLDGKRYPLDGRVSELMLSMLEEIVILREQVDIYEKHVGGRGDA